MNWVLNVLLYNQLHYTSFPPKKDIQDQIKLGPKCPPMEGKKLNTLEDIQNPDAMSPKCPPLEKKIYCKGGHLGHICAGS